MGDGVNGSRGTRTAEGPLQLPAVQGNIRDLAGTRGRLAAAACAVLALVLGERAVLFKTGYTSSRVASVLLACAALWLLFWPSVRRGWADFRAALREWAGERWLALALAAIVVVAAVVRLRYLGDPLRNDEASTFNDWATTPLDTALAQYPAPGN